jgi:hypothetical protein
MDISPETETRLADEARRRGITVDALLQRFVEEQALPVRPARTLVGLPVWHLGVIAPLHL